MSYQEKKDVTDYLVNVLRWTRDQVEDFGPQCQWNKEKMIQTYNNFYVPNIQQGRPQAQKLYAQDIQQEMLNQNDIDDQEQLKIGLMASQFQQDNTPIRDRLKHDYYPVGIQNLGNTCYFNCLLQIIFYNPNLVESILQYKQQENNQPGDTLQQLSQNFMTQLQHVFAQQMLWNQKYLKPSEFYDAVMKFEMQKQNYKIVQNNEFRDLSEYFNCFMELIDQTLSRNFNKLNDQINFFYNEDLEKQYIIKQDKQPQLQWHIGIQNKQIYNFLYKEIIENKNFIKQLPHNLIFTIGRTDHLNKKIEEEFHFPQELHLDFVLRDQQATEHVQKYINQQLQTYKDYQQLKKQVDAFEKVVKHYESLPTFDTFILNSLKFEHKQKIQEMKQYFPLNYHLLNQELQKNSKHLYQLAQIVAHTGSINQGHYYLYQYNFHMKKWFKYNDTVVVIQQEQEVISDSIKQGNILIYINQEQKKKVEQYQKQLYDIETIKKARGVQLLQYDNHPYEYLSKIPLKIRKEVITSNETFQNRYNEQHK
ncbi:unnamed protein product (macronuclear) [Paramecium tetraurelia]|uniref:ubiquitinyl hydrolase 1 n=1 Tax=Paramecium tetraurelia TaxID=5888 RepID=A0C102_PARTE|nr:uncharacterized protein GSPATT00033945001 [Paramecium tetraurelia]CAK64469.1 unnamed protein product [Paramecium tetraurelia]|eukprot:XP_001431867.1 hypothetical protein (macronuclear) [Paramecium tetraurelia strain d4-2]